MAVKERKKKAAVKPVPAGQAEEPQDYEMVTLFKPGATDAENEKLGEVLDQLVTGLGGEIKQLETWGTRKLSYPIAHLGEGYYILCRFKLAPGRTREMDSKLRIDERVLRHLLIAEGS